MIFYPKVRLKFERIREGEHVPYTFGTALRESRILFARLRNISPPRVYDLDVQISPEAWYKLRWSSEIDLLYSLPRPIRTIHDAIALPAYWDKPPERLYGARMIASACAPPDEVTVYRPLTGDMVVYKIA